MVAGVTEVRIDWIAAADATPAALDESARWLTTPEQERLERLRLASGRRDFLLGRWLARRALASWTGVAPEAWWFELGPHGRPEPRTDADPSLSPSVNLSHGGALVVCASAVDVVVGVDVETVRRALPKGRLARFFATEETAALEALSGSEARTERFWRLWTLKEAWLKGRGSGIAGGLGSFAVRFQDPEAPSIAGPPEASGWQLVELRPTPEHRLGLAIRPPAGAACHCTLRRIRP